MNTKDDELKIIKFLLSKSYYKHKISVDDSLLEIIHYNNQLQNTLNKLLSTSDFSSSSPIDLNKFYNEYIIFDNFFEYMFYASESFVRKSAYGK
jgi:hypothetical protein